MSESKLKPYALKFWYQPGAVLTALLAARSGHKLALCVGAFFGWVQALPYYLKTEDGGGLLLLAAPVLGLCGVYFFSWLLRNFSRWFGGQAELFEVRTALGLGLLPWTLVFILLMPLMGHLDPVNGLGQLYWLFFAGFLYGYVVLLLSLSAALRLSPLKTFFCLVVTVLVSLFPLSWVAQLVLAAIAS
ncbi:MAG: hypothetical protein ACI81V_000236 [Lentimonas sp.]|jgi:hypothetical protein